MCMADGGTINAARLTLLDLLRAASHDGWTRSMLESMCDGTVAMLSLKFVQLVQVAKALLRD